jgi:hypothetical protein
VTKRPRAVTALIRPNHPDAALTLLLGEAAVQGTFGAVQGTFGSAQGTFGAAQGTFGAAQGIFGAVQGTIGEAAKPTTGVKPTDRHTNPRNPYKPIRDPLDWSPKGESRHYTSGTP